MDEESESMQPILRDEESSSSLVFTNPPGSKNQLGTLMGVYIPCICSIFGVVLFERLGWLVGEAGLLGTLAMFVLAFAVVFTTSLSISAITTNGQMKGGGVYYMISRSLGPEFGGTIGIIFFLANVTNGSTFLLGFVEWLSTKFESIPETRWWQVLYVAIVLVILMIISLLGAGAFTKVNTLIFIMQWVAIISAFICLVIKGFHGGSHRATELLHENLFPKYTPGYGTMSVFSIAFPSVTGIMAGANMSGDLRKPHESIPYGTLMAITTTLFTYVALVILYAFTVSREVLQTDFYIMQSSTVIPWLVAQGIAGATLCSALACLLGAARILQAIARDDLLPGLSFFKVGSKKGDEPRRAVLLACVLMFCFVLIGNLNQVLPLVTMFYFTTYGITNFACFALCISGAPNFRPLFKYFSWWSSLIGALLCLGGMFVLQPLYATSAMILFGVLWSVIYYRGSPHDWGDLSQAIIYHQVRKYLLKLDSRKAHVKYWRPAVLLLADDIEANKALVSFTNHLKKGGLYVIGGVLVDSVKEKIHDVRDYSRRGWEVIRREKIKGFYEVVIGNSVRDGAANLALTAGLGGMRPNTVILGFFQQHEELPNHDPINPDYTLKVQEYVEIISDAIALEKNVLLARNFDSYDEKAMTQHLKEHKTKMFIDVWHIGSCTGGGTDAAYKLCLQLGYVLWRAHFFTKHCTLRFFALTPTSIEIPTYEAHLRAILLDSRIPNHTVHVVPLTEPHSDVTQLPLARRLALINNTIQSHSTETAVTFIPISRPPDTNSYYAGSINGSEAMDYINDLDVMSADLPPTILVYGQKIVITNEL